MKKRTLTQRDSIAMYACPPCPCDCTPCGCYCPGSGDPTNSGYSVTVHDGAGSQNGSYSSVAVQRGIY